VFLLIGLSGTCLVVSRPARSALLPMTVGPERFTNAVTWNSSMFQITAMVGPALGGLTLHYLSVRAWFIVDPV